MRVGIPKESQADERRVALTPASVKTLIDKLELSVTLERGAGEPAGFLDSAYEAHGAAVTDRSAVFRDADLIAQVRTFGANPSGGDDLQSLRDGQVLVGMSDPLSHPDRSRQIAELGVTHFALELMPRITRAQSMDVLSSMATVAGYKAVIIAADRLPKMFPMFMTAAGTVRPARVFIIGAGVAGLQAIATAKRLGALVSSYDVRPAVKEQVESLGAKFIEFELETGQAEDQGGYAKALGEEFYRKQRQLMGEVIRTHDVVITTAAIPGKKSPVLVTEEMVQGMNAGSVIVDLAAERGGNCALTKLDEVVEAHGVTILGPGNLPAEVPHHASQMYSNNVTTFLKHIIHEGELKLDLEDEITKGTLVSHHKEISHERVRELLAPAKEES